MKISRDQVAHVATLARLEFAEEELERFATQLSSILEYVEQLGELDLEGVEPMAHVLDVVAVPRDDRVRHSLPRNTALSNAPDADLGCFRVPKVIEG